MTTTLTRPAFEVKGNSVLRGLDMAHKPTCDRCQSQLFVEAWFISETATGRTWTVGSGCVKTLTGQTVTQLKTASADFAAAMDDEAERMGRALVFHTWAATNAAELEFIEAHVARIHAAQDKWHAEAHGIGSPSMPPSSEWYEKIRAKVHGLGCLTVAELEAVRREMSLDHDKALPTKKTRDIYSGTVEKVRWSVESYGNTPKASVTVTVRAAEGDLLYFIKVGQDTGLEADLHKLALANGWDGFGIRSQSPSLMACVEAHARTTARAIEAMQGKAIQFKATVKGAAATGGKVYFTRATLVPGQ